MLKEIKNNVYNAIFVAADEEAPRILLPGWRDYQKCGYNESYSLAPSLTMR